MLNDSKKNKTDDSAPATTGKKSVNWGNRSEALRHVRSLGRSEARLVSVTPTLAKEWLAINTNNRPIRRREVDSFVRDIVSDRWIPNTSDTVMIGSNGVLLNGQHRLTAVIEADRSAQMYVEFGAENDASAIDRGRSRSAGDAFQMNTGKRVSLLWLGTAKSMRQGANKTYPTLTTQEYEAFYSEHEAAISFGTAIADRGRRGIRRSPVAAAFARALGNVDQKKLEEFAEVLITGIAPLKSHAIIITLRDLLTSTGRRVAGSGGAVHPVSLYRKTTRAMLAFVNNERIKTLYELSEEPFPLADEMPKGKAKRSR